MAQLYSPFHPAVLRLLASVAKASAHRGIPAGICGEMAGDPLATPLLLGLGFRELSMAPSAIPRVKAALRAIRADAARSLALRCLALPTSEEILALVRQELPPGAVAAA